MALLIATILILVLERIVGLRHASSVYLLAVATVAIGFGSVAAVGTALGGFLIYNYLFVEPLFTFGVSEPNGILNLFLLLIVGILIGRLTGLQRDRERQALSREREARAVFAVTRSLATERRATEALPAIIERLAEETRSSRVWLGFGPTIPQERIAADSATGATPQTAQHFVLRRTPDERTPTWVRINPPGNPAAQQVHELFFRVVISAGADVAGSVWAARPVGRGQPSDEESRLLAATADVVGLASLRDRLAVQATEREIAQRSDELKSALLDSVSHDLRTPLSTIRAAAGSLADPEIDWSSDERRRTARQIDAEADRLNHIVTNLLDMSRIQAGTLQPGLEVLPVEDSLRSVLDRSRSVIGSRPVELQMTDDLPPVQADPVMLEEVIANLLENVGRYTPADASVLISAISNGGRVEIRVEDGGPGLPDDALPRIFEKFYRGPSARRHSGRGAGVGLAVVKGMVEAMGGTVSAGRSGLGGLAVCIQLPAAPRPAMDPTPGQQS